MTKLLLISISWHHVQYDSGINKVSGGMKKAIPGANVIKQKYSLKSFLYNFWKSKKKLENEF